MPIAPSLVQVPEMSGCPHGVFGAVHAFVAPARAAGALSALARACAAAGPAAIMPASTTPDASNRLFISPPGCVPFPNTILAEKYTNDHKRHKGPQRIQRTSGQELLD